MLFNERHLDPPPPPHPIIIIWKNRPVNTYKMLNRKGREGRSPCESLALMKSMAGDSQKKQELFKALLGKF